MLCHGCNGMAKEIHDCSGRNTFLFKICVKEVTKGMEYNVMILSVSIESLAIR